MNNQLTRFSFLILLTILLIGCGGRAHQAEPTGSLKSPETTAAKPESTQLKGEPIKFQTATVTAYRLNLRDKASPKGSVLGVLQKGDSLKVLSQKRNWLEVGAPDGRKGWVYGRYIQIGDKMPNDVKSEKPAIAPPKVQTAKTKDRVQSKPATTPPPKAGQKKVSALRKQLETVWETRRQAHRDSDLALIQKTTSDHTHGTMQNQMMAVGKELKPEDLAFFYEMMPDLTKLKFIELKQNGPTAGLLYREESEKSDDPNLSPPVRFVFIKFVKEARGWTVDGVLSTGMSKYQKEGSEARFDYAALSDELTIDGKVRPAPNAVEKPKETVVEGALDISSYDYKTKVSINGTHQRETEGATSTGAIKGGLKKGKNKIEIVVTKSTKATSDWPPEVTIRYLDTSGKEQEGFKFAPEENAEGTHEFTFTVE